MLTTVAALACRILSNPAANAIQKFLSQKHSAILINLYSYLFLSIFCVGICFFHGNLGIVHWSFYGLNYWLYVLLAGILCTAGSVCLIKALQLGEMSVLGPINSYKCVVGLILGGIFLGEVPNWWGIFGTILIISGSWYIFDTVQEGFSFRLFKRKDIILRFCALFFTGCEAVVLKKIILMSSVLESFILWCITGFVFSIVLLILFRVKLERFFIRDILLTLGIAICLGLMQYSTNIVFERVNVGLSLALFQLSSIVSVIFGYKLFKEEHLFKKIAGTVIMIIGSGMILLS